jgi:hypothetical protein
VHHGPAFLGHGENHLTPVRRVRRLEHEITLGKHSDDAGHGRRLHLLVLGQFTGGHRMMDFQGRQRGELGL